MFGVCSFGSQVLSGGKFSGVKDILCAVLDIVDILTAIAFALILLAFLWGLAKYVFQADQEGARDQGKRIMIGGIIALFVAASIWGIVSFLQGELFGNNIFGGSNVGPPGSEDARGFQIELGF